MYKGNSVLAIITARSGSKRLANKNILELAGKPLIAWSINEAKKSKYVDSLIVSTDSVEIANISKSYGAKVPFIRPKELSNDCTTSVAVLKHAIESLDVKYDYVLLLQPTSPLRTNEDIDNALEMTDNLTKAIISVTKMQHSPLWANTLPLDLSMKNFLKEEVINKSGQDLPDYYRLNGALYLSEVDYFYEHHGFFGEKTRAYIMPQEKSIDIDTEIDFQLARLIIEKKQCT